MRDLQPPAEVLIFRADLAQLLGEGVDDRAARRRRRRLGLPLGLPECFDPCPKLGLAVEEVE